MNSSAFALSPEKTVGSFPSNFPFPGLAAAACAAMGWAGPPPPPPALPPPPPPLVGPGAEPDGGGPEREVKAVAIVDWVGVRVTADILLGPSGMLASLSCGDPDWGISGSSSGVSCTCSVKRSSSSSMGRMTSCQRRSPSNGSRSGFSQNIVGVS